MKKTNLIIIALLISNTFFAQQMLPTPKQVETFLKSRTYVVQNNNIFGMYNVAIEDAAKKHWKITDHFILSKNEFQEKKHIKSASMIVQTETHFE